MKELMWLEMAVLAHRLYRFQRVSSEVVGRFGARTSKGLFEQGRARRLRPAPDPGDFCERLRCGRHWLIVRGRSCEFTTGLVRVRVH
jgi:hypothetical protein